ncbi:Protein kinase C-like 1 [Chytridiales sp. JEL 0842]|nr:Protein kinase C-like 1 [Chytridiales sp. JEL 0842]
MTSSTSVSVNFARREMVILGTQYAGEMKKGVFTVMHYLMPRAGVLSLHSSANEGPNGDVSLFFGLSGTGKTTLSADPHRFLIGDDEHCWSDNGIFNIEGGCYAKCIDLSAEKEPEIFNAIKFGAVVENVVYDKNTRVIDYADVSLTENTRCAYPIEYIPNAKLPCVGGHPKNIILLTCDAFGVLPPVSKLTPAQVSYHFISGYTAKVAGTEDGVTEPSATFSTCFGAPFLVWHPTKYATMLAQKMKEHSASAWLINTGWAGGAYGTGKRISLKYTRAIIDAIHSGELAQAEYENYPVFNLSIPKTCPGVPPEVLNPAKSWMGTSQSFQATLEKLGRLFVDNFKNYADKADAAVLGAGPKLDLHRTGISGPIPSSLASLSSLQVLNLETNELTGTIPIFLTTLSSLTFLDLGTNQLTGTIPTEIGNLARLEVLSLFGNILTGSIPASMGNLSRLVALNLGSLQLTGPIPDTIGNLGNLQTLNLEGSDLTGSIPAGLMRLSSLAYMDLGRNSLSGSIPTEIGNLRNIEVMSFFGNRLTGAIPTTVASLSKLYRLVLAGNLLTGGIPSDLGNINTLQDLILSDNKLTGSVPSSLGKLTNLRIVAVERNSLSGTFPDSLLRLGDKFTYESCCLIAESKSLGPATNSTNTSSPSLPPAPPSNPVPIGTIIGGVLGGIAIIAIGAWLYLRNRKNSADKVAKNEPVFRPTEPAPSSPPTNGAIYTKGHNAEGAANPYSPYTLPATSHSEATLHQPHLVVNVSETNIASEKSNAFLVSDVGQNPLWVQPSNAAEKSTLFGSPQNFGQDLLLSASPPSQPAQSTVPSYGALIPLSNFESRPPTSWTTEEVCSWLISKGIPQNVVNSFYAQSLDGSVLFLLTPEVLCRELRITLGQSNRIITAIDGLRVTLQTSSQEQALVMEDMKGAPGSEMPPPGYDE